MFMSPAPKVCFDGPETQEAEWIRQRLLHASEEGAAERTHKTPYLSNKITLSRKQRVVIEGP